MKANAALVTLAVGEPILAYWNEYCKWNWTEYARLHGYDLHVITELLDRSDVVNTRSPAWQKCLLLGQPSLQHYRQVVLIDADVVINFQTAPPITEWVPEDKVGGVISGAYLQDDLKMIFLERVRNKKYPFRSDLLQWEADQRSFYESSGLQGDFSDIIQTGVLVASPSHHRELFERVYNREFSIKSRDYEQVPLSFDIITQGALSRLNSRFNTVFFERMVVHYPYLLNKQLNHYDMLARIAVFVEWSNSFFLHFAYDRDFARFLPQEKDVRR